MSAFIHQDVPEHIRYQQFTLPHSLAVISIYGINISLPFLFLNINFKPRKSNFKDCNQKKIRGEAKIAILSAQEKE